MNRVMVLLIAEMGKVFLFRKNEYDYWNGISCFLGINESPEDGAKRAFAEKIKEPLDTFPFKDDIKPLVRIQRGDVEIHFMYATTGRLERLEPKPGTRRQGKAFTFPEIGSAAYDMRNDVRMWAGYLCLGVMTGDSYIQVHT